MRKIRRRALKVVAVCFAAFLVLLFAGVLGSVWGTRRVLQSGKLSEWVNGDPGRLYLEYGTASSSWPGKVRVRNLRIRARDVNVEWEFRIDDCRLTVSLPDLIRKKFHAISVDARGLTFRLRQRLDPGPDASKRAEFLPPIDGFAAVPLRGHPPEPPPSDPNDLWAVEVDRLTASPVREIWIDTYRYSGSAELAGGFSLRPRREAKVGPATLAWKSGTLSLFGVPALAPVRARVECRIDKFETQAVQGPQVWDFITAAADWSGSLGRLEFLNFLLGSEPSLSGGKGGIAGTISLDHGKGRIRTSVSAAHATAKYARETFRGAISADIRISSWRPALGAGDVSGSSLALDDVAASSGGARSWWGRFEFASGRIRLVHGGQVLDGSVTSRCRDGRPLLTFFGVGLPAWTRGLLTLEDFSARADVVLAPRLLRIENLEARGGKFQVLGEYVRSGDDREGAFLIEHPPFRVGVEIERGSTNIRLIGLDTWFRQRTGRN